MPSIDWVNFVITGDARLSEPFLSKIAKLSYDQNIVCSTHDKGNILDLVFANKSFVQDVVVTTPLLSDHSLISIKLSILGPKINKNKDIVTYYYKEADTSKGTGVFSKYESAIARSIESKTLINEVY